MYVPLPQAISHDVEIFCGEIEDCIGRQHSEASELVSLAHTLQETKKQTSCMVMERVRVAKGAMGFYRGVKRVSWRGGRGGGGGRRRKEREGGREGWREGGEGRWKDESYGVNL